MTPPEGTCEGTWYRWAHWGSIHACLLGPGHKPPCMCRCGLARQENDPDPAEAGELKEIASA